MKAPTRISKPNVKHKKYSFKKGATLVLFFPRLTEYTKFYKEAMNNSINQMMMEKASTIIIWIAKQNRYSIIKGSVSDYQINVMNDKVNELYQKYVTSKYLDLHKPYTLVDYSDIPPSLNYISDLT